MASPTTSSTPASFTPYQKFVVAILAFLQFTVILDFMIMSPLGAVIMPAMQITPAQFGVVVSAYAFSAGIAGLLAAGFADRYDRKKLLLFFYAGFLIGTLLCALAPNYQFLVFARMVAGLFGGVLGAVILAIIADLFELNMRGRVMGIIQTAFASSQILGLPAGIYFSNHWGWHSPFLIIVGIGLLVGVAIVFALKPVTAHLSYKNDRHPFHHLLTTLKNPSYLLAFGTTALLSIGGFMMMPFASAYTTGNLGISLGDLPLIYLATGLCTIVVAPLVGKASDSLGKYPTFIFGTIVSIITVITYTHMGVSPLWAVMAINMIMFVGIFSRMIPSQALMSALPDPQDRGAFMSLSSSLQQVAGGIASVVAGAIVVQSAEGHIEHFDTVGFVMCATAIVALVMMFYVTRLVTRKLAK